MLDRWRNEIAVILGHLTDVAGGPDANHVERLSVNAMVWACRYMPADLGGRYDEEPLSGLRRALDELTGCRAPREVMGRPGQRPREVAVMVQN